MYIIKNAIRSITRSKGRNILIGLIALVIAVSACVALSIREAASKAREDALSLMNITAQISIDRQAMMQSARPEEGGEFDRDAMRELLQGWQSLSLAEYEKYAAAKSVSSTYYTLSATLDASEDIEPIDTQGTFERPDNESTQNGGNTPNMPNGQGNNHSGMNFKGKMGAQGDFTVIGYSSDSAMKEFVDGTYSILSGAVFAENTAEKECIISEELATYNDLSVGSEITFLNPNNEEESFTFKIVGIYTGTDEASGGMMGGFNTASDPANTIMTGYSGLKALCDASAAEAEEITDEKSGLTSSTAVSTTLEYTYVLEDVDAFETFKTEVAELGLEEKYTVSSNDITSFEQSLTPLENLSKTATYFLIVVFAIGGVILVVINIFNIRERKYEIGVLTAIGMKKGKVALQFVTELFIVTLAAIVLGAGIGAASSVPVTNALLSAQISANQQTFGNIEQGFGRENNAGMGGMMGMPNGDMPSGEIPDNMPDRGGFGGKMQELMGNTANYISEVSYSTNLTVILQLILVGIGLTLVSSLAAVMFIMRYEPLKILTGRD